MTSNHRYEQIPIEDPQNDEHALHNNSTDNNRPNNNRQHERSDLEETFDLDNDNDHEQVQLLPPSPVDRSNIQPQHIQPHSTDGVFSNMSAKPESDTKKEDVPPSYEEASADATPPYWQTTIFAPPGMGDMVLVEGLPVGNIFSFLWNLMVSASFQLVGFMLTYLLHTTHAAKDGARAGLGISFIQYGFYVRSRGTMDEDFDYDGEGHETVGHDAAQANMIAYIVMFIGWFIVLRAVSDYLKAKKMEKIITAEPTDADQVV